MGNRLLWVEFLFTPGCECAGPALRLLRRILGEKYGAVPVTVRVVADDFSARRYRYRGSPTIRFNGKDIERPASDPGAYHLGCRSYSAHGACQGVPDPELIRAALGSGPMPTDAQTSA